MEDNKEIKEKNSNTNTSGTQESEKSTSKAVISAEIIELLTEFVGNAYVKWKRVVFSPYHIRCQDHST